MTQEQFDTLKGQNDVIIAKLNAVLKATAPAIFDNPLVGTGEPKPAAPTKAEVTANPARYDGTSFDPIHPNHRVTDPLEVARFESPGKAGLFTQGTLAQWAAVDLAGCWRYITSQYPGIALSSLSAGQKIRLGIPVNPTSI